MNFGEGANCYGMSVSSLMEYEHHDYDQFLEKIGWDEEERTTPSNTTNKSDIEEPKVNRKENKKLRTALIQERNKLTSPLKKETEKLESAIMELEEQLEDQHKELILASNSGDNSKVMDISRVVTSNEKEVEHMFELLEIASVQSPRTEKPIFFQLFCFLP